MKFAADVIGEDAQAKAASLQAGEILLLENLRFHAEETAGARLCSSTRRFSRRLY